MLALFIYGKMYVGVLDGGSAHTATPPLTGVLPADVELLLEQPATTSASAAASEASTRPRIMSRDTPGCAEAGFIALVPSRPTRGRDGRSRRGRQEGSQIAVGNWLLAPSAVCDSGRSRRGRQEGPQIAVGNAHHNTGERRGPEQEEE